MSFLIMTNGWEPERIETNYMHRKIFVFIGKMHTFPRQRKQMHVFVYNSSFKWNLSLLLRRRSAPTREIVIIKENTEWSKGEIEKPLLLLQFSFSLYYSYNLFEAIFQSHSACGQLKKRSAPSIMGIVRGLPSLHLQIPPIDQRRDFMPYSICIPLPGIRYAAQSRKPKWHFNMPSHEAQFGFH